MSRRTALLPRVAAVVLLLAFVVLTALVASGATESFDTAARDLFRPDDRWGELQIKMDHLVEIFQPLSMFAVLGVVGLSESVGSGTRQPLLFVALVTVASVSVSLLTKFLVERPDPHLVVSALGGSYPSGHVVAVLVCLGTVVLLLDDSPGWWAWALVAAAGAVMGVALLVTATHWCTDVLGSALLSAAVLAWSRGAAFSRDATTAAEPAARPPR